MAHSNQIQEFLLTNNGVGLIDIYTGSGEVLTGSARATQEAGEKATEMVRWREVDRRLREQERKKNALETKITAMRAEFDVETQEVLLMAEEEQKRQAVQAEDRLDMAQLRRGKPFLPPQAMHSKKKK
jgi:circadian clock protein KaiC